MRKIILILAILLISSLSYAAAPTRVATYTSGAVISNTDVTSNEDAIFTYLQGGVDVIKDNTIVAADIQDSAITTAKILDGTITTADISASAAIPYSKLDLTGGIVTADLSGAIALTTTATTTTSGLSVTGFLKDKDGDIGTSGQYLQTTNGLIDWATWSVGYTQIAWVKFQIDGTIDDSYNVTNITDTGAGDWTVNWSITFANVNYACFVTPVTDGDIGTAKIGYPHDQPTTTTAHIKTTTVADAVADPIRVQVLALGD